jgi:integrase
MQHPVTVSIAMRPDDLLCPVSAYRWFYTAGRSYHVPQGPDAPLFLTLLDPAAQRVEPTTAEEFTRRLRFWMGAACPSVDLARYAGHSFRRGGATAMLLAGVHPSVIQRHGRWQSDTWRRYIDTLDNPAARLLATRSLPQQRGAPSISQHPRQ